MKLWMSESRRGFWSLHTIEYNRDFTTYPGPCIATGFSLSKQSPTARMRDIQEDLYALVLGQITNLREDALPWPDPNLKTSTIEIEDEVAGMLLVEMGLDPEVERKAPIRVEIQRLQSILSYLEGRLVRTKKKERPVIEAQIQEVKDQISQLRRVK